MSHQQTVHQSSPEFDRDQQLHPGNAPSLLEEQRQRAIERRSLIQQGVAPLRRFSRNGVHEAELAQDALAEIDTYLATLEY